MKKLFFLGAAFTCTVCMTAQEVSHLDKDITEKEVPAPVMKTWNAQHPGQKVDRWELKAGNYEADFTKDGKLHEISMDKNGKWIETEMAVDKADVPQAVLDAAGKDKTYKDWAFDHAEKVSTPKHKELYEVTVKKGEQLMGLYYTPDGKTLVRVEKD